ncbi:MAG: hypothetical protein ACI9KE_002862 [Polyangiales bacterium]|jgi:hypothetical protein
MKKLLVLLCFVALACGEDDRVLPDGGAGDTGPGFDVPTVPDAGPTADSGPGSDASPTADAGRGSDAGPVPVDSGPPPVDAPTFDVPVRFDAGPGDAGPSDAGPVEDAMPDVPTDAGPPPDTGGLCSVERAGYGACTPDRGCLLAGQFCEGERAFTTGGVTDPIMSAPAGSDPIPLAIFADGTCTPSPLATTGTPEACDADDETSCGSCGSCTDLGGVTMCLKACEPNLTDNDVCRDNYNCSLTDAVCLPLGCSSDVECRVSRQESNGVPGIQTPNDCMASPAECAGGPNNFDGLLYDTSSSAICNSDTWECEGEPSNPAASGGDMCTTDADCEEGGLCIEQGGSCSTDNTVDCVTNDQCTAAITGAGINGVCDTRWSGGACAKLGCDVVGNECANDGVCQERGIGVPACLDGCTLGAGATPADPATWVDDATGAGGCRSGYSCSWNGVGAAGVANNGVCVTGEFSPVVADNVGAACDTASDCWGPFGQQRCLRFDPAAALGICTVSDCTAPFFSDLAINVCGTDNSCVDFGDAGDPFGLCLQGCSAPSDCSTPDLGCVEVAPGAGDVCFPGCQVNADCQVGRSCFGAGADLGECR